MKSSQRVPGLAAVRLLTVVVVLTSVSLDGQSPPDSARGGQPLTIFNRQGKVAATIGEPGLYSQPAFSPDGTRVAVAKVNPLTQTTDIWVLSLGAGQSTRITSDPAADTEPVWSPDGTQLAFISRRSGTWAVTPRARHHQR